MVVEMTKLERYSLLLYKQAQSLFNVDHPYLKDLTNAEELELKLLEEELKKAEEFYDSRNDSEDVKYAKLHQHDNCGHEGTIMRLVSRWNGAYSESGICPKCKQIIVKPFAYNRTTGKWE